MSSSHSLPNRSLRCGARRLRRQRTRRAIHRRSAVPHQWTRQLESHGPELRPNVQRVAHRYGQVASATSGADGTFSLGTVKPGPYILEATAPSSSSYRVTHWGFVITEYAPSRIELGVVLYRR